MKYIKRVYAKLIRDHFKENRQMLFLSGPRQVGKTTTSLIVSEPAPLHFYLNWDAQRDRELIVKGAEAVADFLQLHKLREGEVIVVFDELHKYRRWKDFLKGFFDKYANQVKILVTGSSRLDIYKSGGDSLMGRYFPLRLHPLSVGELVGSQQLSQELSSEPHELAEEHFQNLFNFGGFPEPFLKANPLFYTRWRRLRRQQLFEEDLRDLTRIQELGQIQLLAELLKQQAGQLTNYSTLATKINVSVDTIKRWLETLKAFYYCFTIRPWTKNVARSLIKEPKIYLWDWSALDDIGAKVENFIASHLLKAVHFWTDQGLGDYELYFLRDKEKREVDFLLTKNNEPWMLVEVKNSGNGGISKNLFYYQEMLQADWAIQVAFNLPYVAKNCFIGKEPIIVPAKTFLSQLI